MGDLRDKLRRSFGHKGGIGMPQGVRDALRRRHERTRTRQIARGVALPVEEDRVISDNNFYLRRLVYGLDHVHGKLRLGDALAATDRLVELAKDDTLANLDPERCLFLDTETTGLSGGAGTVVFMCGLGFFEQEHFVLEQTFLRSYGEEAASLTHVTRRLREYPTLVTFVGKSFDRHRLHARMTVNKVEGSRQMLSARHLDLYHLARRRYGSQLENVRLQTVEQELLGVFRDDDLPGAEAPVAFMDWIRDGHGAVDRVFEHNRLDVLSLVALLALLGR